MARGTGRSTRHRAGRAAPLALATALPALALAACSAGESSRPDLFLVTVDSLRADHLACYGGPEDLGRVLCGADAPGTRFVWAFSTAPSGPPAAASLLCSLYPSDHGVAGPTAGFLASSNETVAEILASGGYRTAAFVSSPELNRARNFQQGFEVYDDRLERDAEGRPRRGAGETTDRALAWLASTPAPRFVWVHYGDLHGPLPGPIPSYEEYERRYREALRRLDVAVGRLLAEAPPGAARPGVLIAGLHGEAAGEKGHWFQHGYGLGLELVRVPLLWAPPEREPEPLAPTSSVVPVSLVDALPTLVSAAGLAVPDTVAGEVLPGPVDPPPTPGLRAVFVEHPARVAVVAGTTYYARDREVGSPARYALLEREGVAPELHPALTTDALGPLEERVREFLGQVRDSPAGARGAEGPP